MFTFFKSVWKYSWLKRQTKTAPSRSSILMLLTTTDKLSEFDWICVDQGLDFILEGHAIFCGMPSNSSVVFTLSTDIMLFWIWRSSRPCGDGRNPIILNQYGEQLCIRHWKWMVHFGLFPFLALVMAWVRPLIVLPCEPLGQLKTDKGDLGIPWWMRTTLDRLF